MASIDDAQYQRVIGSSELARKYATAINRESAHEILQKKLDQSSEAEEVDDRPVAPDEDEDFAWRKAKKPAARRTATRTSSSRPRQSTAEKMVNRAVQTVAREGMKEVRRGLMGVLKGWF